jgi:hypothetical protein
MAAKAIPVPGEVYLGGTPHPLKVLKATYGHSTALDQYVASSIGTTYRTLFTIPAGCLVDHMLIYTKKGFSSSKVYFGDTDNTSGWFAGTSDEIKSSSYLFNSLNSTEPISTFKAGKYYSAVGTIRAKNGTKLTTGAADVYLVYSMAPKQ